MRNGIRKTSVKITLIFRGVNISNLEIKIKVLFVNCYILP